MNLSEYTVEGAETFTGSPHVTIKHVPCDDGLSAVTEISGEPSIQTLIDVAEEHERECPAK